MQSRKTGIIIIIIIIIIIMIIIIIIIIRVQMINDNNNNLAGVRKDSAKSAGHLILLSTEQMTWSILGHKLRH